MQKGELYLWFQVLKDINLSDLFFVSHNFVICAVSSLRFSSLKSKLNIA